MESKILDEDKDEWMYKSMKKYSNLYMYELEFPVDALEVIGETSLCLCGTQVYSRKCEILQLSIPRKLFPSEDESLCKDRDFQIISGGYASSKMKQIKPIRGTEDSMVCATSKEQDGVFLFKLGNEESAIIKELGQLPTSSESSRGVVDTYDGRRIIFANEDGKFLKQWTLDLSQHSPETLMTLNKSPPGKIVKIKYWDANTVSFLSSSGTVSLYDLRSNSVTLQITPSKFSSSTVSPSTSGPSSPRVMSSEENPQNPPEVIFTFDTIPSQYKIGIVDSSGGYETYDARHLETTSSASTAATFNIAHQTTTTTTGRQRLPGFDKGCTVVRDRLDMEFRGSGSGGAAAGINELIVTGLVRNHVVHVLAEKKPSVGGSGAGGSDGEEILTIFEHDGHSRTVTHARWHPTVDRLVFSASVDSMLHAWQFVEE